MHPTNQMQSLSVGVKPIVPSPYCCTAQLEVSSLQSRVSHWRPWVPQSAKKSAAWSSRILQACLSITVVVPIGFAAC
jgi:hypothetical protein